MGSVDARLLRALRYVAVLSAGGFSLLGVFGLFFPMAVGCDFSSVRNAAVAMLHGRSVYSASGFVYPPTAAVLALPLGGGSPVVSYAAWTVVCLAGLAVSMGLIVRMAPPRWRWGLAALSSMSLLGGCVATDSLSVGNASVLLVPVCVGALIAFDRGHWTAGCGLLAASLLLKPLLVPLLLVPLLKGRWRPLAVSLTPAALLLLAGVAWIPGGGSLTRVLAYCLRGSNLHGAAATNNLSLRGWTEVHRWPTGLGLACSVAIAGYVLTNLLARRRSVDAVAAGGLVFGATLLAGDIAESHYLLSLGAIALTLVALRPSLRNAGLLIPGVALLALPVSCRSMLGAGDDRQTWYVVAELLLLAGFSLVAAAPAGEGRTAVEERAGELAGVR